MPWLTALPEVLEVVGVLGEWTVALEPSHVERQAAMPEFVCYVFAHDGFSIERRTAHDT